MQWKPPTQTNPVLFLPLCKSNTSLKITQCDIAEKFSTPVSTDWLQVWNTPNNTTEKNMCKNLITLLTPCAEIIRNAQSHINFYEKKSKYDLVTDADIGLELLIRHWFTLHLPKHKIIGEEIKNESITKNDIVWYLDPIDGTSNFCNNSSNYCINLGSTYNGQPYINIIYHPPTHTVQTQCLHATSTYTFTMPSPNTLCSEYLENNIKQHQLFNTLLTQSNTTAVQTKAIGISLLEMINGNISAFYKPFVKPWDIMAGAGILSTATQWDITFITTDFESISLFSNNTQFITNLNASLQQNNRMGHVIISLKSEPTIKKIIVNQLKTL